MYKEPLKVASERTTSEAPHRIPIKTRQVTPKQSPTYHLIKPPNVAHRETPNEAPAVVVYVVVVVCYVVVVIVYVVAVVRYVVVVVCYVVAVVELFSMF